MGREFNLGWVNTSPLDSLESVKKFESHFQLTLPQPLEVFLQVTNAGSPVGGQLPTPAGPRGLESMMDFSSHTDPRGAWALNSRMQRVLGAQRVAIGTMEAGDLLCVRREGRDRSLEILDRRTYEFFPACSVPAFLERFGKI